MFIFFKFFYRNVKKFKLESGLRLCETVSKLLQQFFCCNTEHISAENTKSERGVTNLFCLLPILFSR